MPTSPPGSGSVHVSAVKRTGICANILQEQGQQTGAGPVCLDELGGLCSGWPPVCYEQQSSSERRGPGQRLRHARPASGGGRGFREGPRALQARPLVRRDGGEGRIQDPGGAAVLTRPGGSCVRSGGLYFGLLVCSSLSLKVFSSFEVGLGSLAAQGLLDAHAPVGTTDLNYILLGSSTVCVGQGGDLGLGVWVHRLQLCSWCTKLHGHAKF